jgi:hypothetical protein
MRNATIACLLLFLAGCPAPAPNQQGPQGSGLNPDSCGQLPTNDVGRKVGAFLNAAVLLEKETKELDAQTRALCLSMGSKLGVKLTGDTKTICNKVATQLRSDISTSLKPEAKLIVKHQPAVCKVDMDAAIKAQAQCEAKAEAEVNVSCKGTCQGTCRGKCNGTCSATNADGSCAGSCSGVCEGGCSGSCQGEANASGSVECEAVAEVRTNLDAQCTPPTLEIVFDPKLVVNQAKLDKAIAAINVGLPGLLALSAKASGPVLSSVVTFAKAATALVNSSGNFAASLGAASVCVIAQLVAAATVAVNVQVTIQVSVEASASVGGACGATTN